MFFIAYTFKGQVHVFAGWVKIVRHSSCRTSELLKYFCPLYYLISQSIENKPSVYNFGWAIAQLAPFEKWKIVSIKAPAKNSSRQHCFISLPDWYTMVLDMWKFRRAIQGQENIQNHINKLIFIDDTIIKLFFAHSDCFYCSISFTFETFNNYSGASKIKSFGHKLKFCSISFYHITAFGSDKTCIFWDGFFGHPEHIPKLMDTEITTIISMC